MATTGLEDLICFELYAASRHVIGQYRPELDAAGLTYPQFLVLRVLWHRGPTTVRDLGTALHLDSGTLSPMLKRLETAGHLTRHRATTDERTVEIHLTPTGHALRDRLAGLPQTLARTTDLTPAEWQQLKRLLQRLHQGEP